MNFENRYSWSSRFLHRLAFRSGGLQVALADVEAQMFKSELEAASAERPVFVTALPRAGTTILLNLLVETGLFASHTYRDMPFVLCPMLWQKMTGSFQKHEELRERAHGDGLKVSPDSPEAFEEMIWKQFWPEHYRDTHIEPWSHCEDEEFLDFFRSHMKRVVALRRGSSEDSPRYVSKNNLNISRLGCLPAALPDARFIVPFRDPLQHAASLLRQHLSFLEAHRDDPFTREYMEGVGHYDFGLNLKPVDFGHWVDRDRRPDAVGLDFWLEYWVESYQEIARYSSDQVRLMSYRWFTERPRQGLEWVASFIGLDTPATLVELAPKVRAPREHEIDLSVVDGALLEKARSLYEELERDWSAVV